MKKSATKSEKDYMGQVAKLPCVACGQIGVHVHHVKSGAMGKRSSDFLTVALCPECHQGSLSIHMTPRQFHAIYGSEDYLLAKTIEGVFR